MGRNMQMTLNTQELEGGATAAVVKWLTRSAPTVGAELFSAAGDDPALLEDLTFARMHDDSTLAIPAAEEAHFALLNLAPDGVGRRCVNWDCVLRALGKRFRRG